ncbi:hypothetical protein KGQ29_04180 [Patescibacteria group bacterium]|nr:hypothetical protein [Patescibacteria group bacterium]
MENKKEPNPNIHNEPQNKNYLQEWQKTNDYYPIKKNKPQKASVATSYKPLNQIEIRKRELHLQWVRTNTDLITGKVTGIPENQWMKEKHRLALRKKRLGLFCTASAKC